MIPGIVGGNPVKAERGTDGKNLDRIVPRIRLSRAKGWRMPSNTVVASRPSKWGNPDRMDGDHSRAGCVAAFACWIRDSPDRRALAAEAQARLRGKNLACW
jgi:hypothetical protein